MRIASLMSGRLVLLVLVCAVGSGCGGGEGDVPQGGPREKTSPVAGQVMVDGQPVAGLRVTCHPQGASKIQRAVALTDAEGRFAITTYLEGDGVPVGSYKITFMWGERGRRGYGGPDKLKGKYSDPEKSEFNITVVEGQPTDLGVIELTIDK